MTVSEQEIEEKIFETLKLSYLPLTAPDILEFIEEKLNEKPNENTFKAVLKRLADNDFIEKKKIIGRRRYHYSTKEREDIDESIEIYIIGKTVTFSSDIPEQERPEEKQFFIKSLSN